MQEKYFDKTRFISNGFFYSFEYYPRRPKELYDETPFLYCIGPVEKRDNLITGINLHHIDYASRCKLIELMQRQYNILDDDNQHIISEESLNRLVPGVLFGVFKGKKDKADVGAKASPVIGQGKLKDLVYFTVTGLSEEGREKLGLHGEETAALIALNKDTGKTEWAMGMESRTESSPVAVYDGDGNGWIIQCAQDGNIYMVDGLTGREVGQLKLEAEILASPAVYNDTMVIGTTGKGTSDIYGIEIRTLKSGDAPQEAGPEETPEPEEKEPEMKEEPEEETEATEEFEEEWNEEEGEGINE